MKHRDLQALLTSSQGAAKHVYPEYRWTISEALDSDNIMISAVAPMRRGDQHRTAYANAATPGHLLEAVKDPVEVMTVGIQRTQKMLADEIDKMKQRGWVVDELVTR